MELRCGQENEFLIKDIYEETFKRIINPIYIVITALISSLIILKSKIKRFQNYFKVFLFFGGFVMIIISELGYKFISSNTEMEIFFIFLPIIFVFLFYFYILLKTNFKIKHL